MDYRVTFQPSGKRGNVSDGTTLLDAARDFGVDIENICGGKKTCGKCRVIIEDGADGLSSLTEEEKKELSVDDINAGYRLACCAEVHSSCWVVVPEESRGGEQVIRKAAAELDIELDPPVRKYFVKLDEATLHDSEGDLERLLKALNEQHGLKEPGIDFCTLAELQDTVRRGRWEVTVTVLNGTEIIRVESGECPGTYGLAVDIGTTTVAGYLTDLKTGDVLATESMMNPQVSYGEDVMSRITYAMQEDGGLEKLSAKIVGGLNEIATNATRQVGLNINDISEVTIVGNTAMHHIWLKLNPSYIGMAPFPPALHRSFDLRAREVGMETHPSTNVHVLPIEAGFVGADNVGVLLTVQPYEKEEMQLIIDIGTNGEIVLGNRERLISASCATGPALEGAHIRYGMRAAPGAIERMRIEPDSLDVQYEVIGDEKPRGICGSGIIEAVAELFKTGVVLKTGNFNKTLENPRVRKGEDGYEFVFARADETAIGSDIVMNQKDIRSFQLAKGALQSGSRILMNNLGVEELDRVVLAGAFGSYIDREASMVVGLYPDCDLTRVEAVGNAAGDGARIALLNRARREEAGRVARSVEYIELTIDPLFEKEFMRAMHFPHMDWDLYPHVKHILDEIPEPPSKKAQRGK